MPSLAVSLCFSFSPVVAFLNVDPSSRARWPRAGHALQNLQVSPYRASLPPAHFPLHQRKATTHVPHWAMLCHGFLSLVTSSAAASGARSALLMHQFCHVFYTRPNILLSKDTRAQFLIFVVWQSSSLDVATKFDCDPGHPCKASAVVTCKPLRVHISPRLAQTSGSPLVGVYSFQETPRLRISSL